MRIEPAVGEPGLFHHVGHPDPRIALAAQRARGDFDDAVVRGFVAGSGGHGASVAQNMMTAIFCSPAIARPARAPALRPSARGWLRYADRRIRQLAGGALGARRHRKRAARAAPAQVERCPQERRELPFRQENGGKAQQVADARLIVILLAAPVHRGEPVLEQALGFHVDPELDPPAPRAHESFPSCPVELHVFAARRRLHQVGGELGAAWLGAALRLRLLRLRPRRERLLVAHRPEPVAEHVRRLGVGQGGVASLVHSNFRR